MINKINPSVFDRLAGHPLQTWEWGEFRKEWGNTVERLIYKDKKKQKALQIIFSKIPHTDFTIGTALKCDFLTREVLKKIKEKGEKANAIFIKIEPNIRKDQKEKGKQIEILKNEGCAKGKPLFTPQTFLLDVRKSEEELLLSFHPKTRYNIRYAQRKGVKIEEDNSTSAFKRYLKLTFETAKRQNFYAHTPKYHQIMWKHLYTSFVKQKREPIAHLLTAKYKGKIIVAWIVFTLGKFLYYPYGASDYKYHKLMASNLMLWEAIRFAKNKGLEFFDLWGKEEGKGFTRFKEGYNPETVEFIGSWDLVINKKAYIVYKIADKIRWFFLKKILPFFR